MSVLKKFERFFNGHKLRTKMMLIYIIVIIPVFIGSMFLLYTIRTNLSESETDNAVKNTDNIRIHLTDMVYTIENITDVICNGSDIPSFICGDYTKNSEIYRFYADNDIIDNYVSIFPQLKAIRIYIPRDDFVFNSNFRRADDGITSQTWYNAAIDTPFPIWRVIRDPVTREVYLSCARRICSADGTPCAVAVLAISPDWLEDYITNDTYSTVLSVNNGIVYFSSLEGINSGNIITVSSTDFTKPNVEEVIDSEFNNISALTILKTFSSGLSENVFQIFLINPGSSIEAENEQLTSFYSLYILFLFVISLLIVVLFVISYSRRITLLRDKMHSVALGNFNVTRELEDHDEVAQLEEDLCIMVDSMQLMMNDIYNAKLESERLKLNQRDAEFKALASQINPHFLYNTLETIRMKAFCNNDKETADLIKKLGKFMRRCLEIKTENVTLKSEIDFTNSYLELQSARFGDKISYEIRSSVSDDYMILPLIIQPVVENAFVHGIESSKSNGKIDVHIYCCGEYVYIDVTDNGVGITPEKLKQLDKKLSENNTEGGKSIGLTNVNKRIQMSYGDIYGIKVTSKEGEGTSVRIMLPRYPENTRKGTNNADA
ncbi:MAG: histidine kinase [Oscillospiraceae bacterium]|nr:histidine kinase [Oscillospiraceae bacterium]